MSQLFKSQYIIIVLVSLLSACNLSDRKVVSEVIPDEYYLSKRSNYSGFKYEQLGFERVRIAYKDAQRKVFSKLEIAGISQEKYKLHLRAFKKEEILEIWVKPSSSQKYSQLLSYKFCENSGIPGPKRKQGDRQIPEGFYHIDVFNPNSSYFLSLGLSYPNQSDKIYGDKLDPGGDIFIHGNCVTIGCIPITDEGIKELYILAIEAKSNGQQLIPVHIFPAKMGSAGMKNLRSKFPQNISFWENLKPAYDFFEKNKSLPEIEIDGNGKYIIVDKES